MNFSDWGEALSEMLCFYPKTCQTTKVKYNGYVFLPTKAAIRLLFFGDTGSDQRKKYIGPGAYLAQSSGDFDIFLKDS